MPPRLRSGDVLEIEFPKVPSPNLAFPDGGFGYLTYVGKAHDRTTAVRVRPGILYERPAITEELFHDSYISFYAASYALKLGLVKVVGHLAPVPMPTVFRRGGMKLGNSYISYLIDVHDGTTVTTTPKRKLADEEKKINIRELLNHEALLDYISRGWRPEWESADLPEIAPDPEAPTQLDAPPESPEPPNSSSSARVASDALVILEVAKSSDLAITRGIRHYLYLPTKKVAQQVATILQQRDFDIELRRAAVGKTWLVLASHRVVLSGGYIANMRVFLEELVEPLHGEYDGWEAEVNAPEPGGQAD